MATASIIQDRAREIAERDRFFDMSLDMLCIAGFDGYLKMVNPAFQRILGWTADELQARPFLDIVHPDDYEKVTEAMRTLAGSTPIVNFECRSRCKDGTYKWVACNSFPLVHEGLIYAVCRDITETKLAEQTIRELNEQLQARAALLDVANRELEAFAYSVSHDLRTPLRQVASFLKLLRQNTDAGFDATNREYLDITERTTRQMAQLIDDLLEFSRMGTADIRWSHVHIGSLVHDISTTLSRETQDRHVEWSIDTLPLVAGDRQLLKLVFVNILGNAVKFTRTKDKASIQIGVSAGRPSTVEIPPNHVVIHVTDNGVGMDMNYAERLFGVFQRFHSASDFEGTGIGLANVKRIVGRHGGRVWAESQPERGATFFLSLPLVEAP